LTIKPNPEANNGRIVMPEEGGWGKVSKEKRGELRHGRESSGKKKQRVVPSSKKKVKNKPKRKGPTN